MNKVLMTAGIVMVIGLGMIVVFDVMYYLANDDYIDLLGSMHIGALIDSAKDANLYGLLSAFGFAVFGTGVALLAFGLALNEPKSVQFRQVETQVPPMQYQPQQYPPSPPQG